MLETLSTVNIDNKINRSRVPAQSLRLHLLDVMYIHAKTLGLD